MRFILVGDQLSAHQVRASLVTNTSGPVLNTQVGNFSVLLSQLRTSFLLEAPAGDWMQLLTQAAIKMPNAFWGQSIQVDEPTVVLELAATLKHLLVTQDLRSDLQPISHPKTRIERYYNDLVALHQQMNYALPSDLTTAKQCLERIEKSGFEEALYPIEVTLLAPNHYFEPWQQQLLKTLKAQESEFKIPSPASKPAESTPFKLFEQLFSESSDKLKTIEKKPTKPEGLYGVLCRDALQECEAIASMISQGLNQGAKPEEIAVVYPSHSYAALLTQALQRLNIPTSHLPEEVASFDWATALVRDWLTVNVTGSAPMALKSLLANPLMPWFRHKNRLSMRQEKADEVKAGLWQKLTTPLISANQLLASLESLMSDLRFSEETVLHQARLKTLFQQFTEQLTLLEGLPFEEQVQRLLNTLHPEVLKETDYQPFYLNAITLLPEHHTLLMPVKHLFIVGFNQGLYSYTAHAQSTLWKPAQWQQLAQCTQLPLNDFIQRQTSERERFKQLLTLAEEQIIFTAAQQDFSGEALALSETALDITLCFTTVDAVGEMDWFQPLPQCQHPWLAFESIASESEFEPIKQDIQLNVNLLACHKDAEGNPRTESPSSLEKMMISPLDWFLNRQGIEDKTWQIETLDIMLQGTIAHKVFELYKEKQASHLDEELFKTLYQQALEQTAPFLQQPQWKLERIQLQQEIKKALASFICWQQETGWQIKEVEQKLTGSLWQLPMMGYVDAILVNEVESDEQVMILDYKKSKSGSRLKRLKEGFDLQTYLYRQLYQQRPSLDNAQMTPLSGYYTLNDQTLVMDQTIEMGHQDCLSLSTADIPVPEQSVKARDAVYNRLQQLKAGWIELNHVEDIKTWEGRGITPYALKDHPIVIRFLRKC